MATMRLRYVHSFVDKTGRVRYYFRHGASVLLCRANRDLSSSRHDTASCGGNAWQHSQGTTSHSVPVLWAW